MNKVSKLNFRKILLIMCLIGLLFGVETIEAKATSVDEGTTKPNVEVSTLKDLVAAIQEAEDGDVIGINAIIGVYEDVVIGDVNKHITILRTSENAKLDIAGQATRTIQNITFDGNGISSNAGMIDTSGDVSFENVVFQNGVCTNIGGAVTISTGIISFKDCEFKNNSANQGGHISMNNNAIVTLNNCVLTTGNAEKGAAISIGSNGATCSVIDSKISENAASDIGGGIYNKGALIIEKSKVFKNTAITGGADIANLGWQQIEKDMNILTDLYLDEDITIKGWMSDYSDESTATYLKFDFEIPETPVEPQDPGSDSGDEEVPPVEPENPTTPDPTNPPVEPENPGNESESGNGEVTNPEPTPNPENPNPDQGNESDGDSQKPDPAPNPDKENPTPTPVPNSPSNGDKAPTTTPENSNNQGNDNKTPSPNNTTSNSSSSTDNSSVKDDHSTIKNDYSGSNNTSTVNNYYTTDSSTHTTKTEARKGDDDKTKTVVVKAAAPVVNVTSPSAEKRTEVKDTSKSQNIKIEANGADCVIRQNEDGYTISINSKSNNQAVKVDAHDSDSYVNWYEVIKICLLASIVVVLLWKPRTKDIM